MTLGAATDASAAGVEAASFVCACAATVKQTPRMTPIRRFIGRLPGTEILPAVRRCVPICGRANRPVLGGPQERCYRGAEASGDPNAYRRSRRIAPPISV